MTGRFDKEQAKKYLEERDQKERVEQEKIRLELLEKTLFFIKRELTGVDVQVYLAGSILRPYEFTKNSDIDMVLKDFQGDRFELWTKLESLIGRTVELILFENCHFQEYIEKEGLKVL